MTVVSGLLPAIQAIKRQRRRLRRTWSNSKLETWSAHTTAIMGNVGLLRPLTKRLQDLIRSPGNVSIRVEQVHEVLDSAIEILEANLFTMNEGEVTDTAGLPYNINITIPQIISQIQEQKIVQKLHMDWPLIESEIDEDEGIPQEKKEEAKGHARVIWEGLVNKSKDAATILGAVYMLSQLGMAMEKISTLFGLGG